MGDLDNAADADDGRVEHDAQQHDHHHLHLLDIIGGAGDEGGGGEAVDLRAGEGDHLFKHVAAQVHADLSGGAGGQQAHQNGGGHHQQGDAQHLGPGEEEVVHLDPVQVQAHGGVLVLHEEQGLLLHDELGLVAVLGQKLPGHLVDLFPGNRSPGHGGAELVHVHCAEPAELFHLLLRQRSARRHGGRLPGVRLTPASLHVEQQHGHAEGLVQGGDSVLVPLSEDIGAVRVQGIGGVHQGGVGVAHEELQILQRAGADPVGRHPLDAPLLDAHIHDVRRVLRQAQVAHGLNHQQQYNRKHGQLTFF